MKRRKVNEKLLLKVFGPEPDNTGLKPVDERKIIPYHDCEYVDQVTWSAFGMSTQLCRVCQMPPPAPPREDP